MNVINLAAEREKRQRHVYRMTFVTDDLTAEEAAGLVAYFTREFGWTIHVERRNQPSAVQR